MAEAGYHQANLVEAIAEKLAEIQQETPAPPAPPVNETPTDPIIPASMAQMQQLMAAMQTGPPQTAAPAQRTREARPPPTGPRTGEPIRALPPWATKYCWTHGKCAHSSVTCNNKAPGHQPTSTMENKMSGSTYGCT
jgi:hypothetical protein